MRNKIIISLILILFAFPQMSFSQDSSSFDLTYEVYQVYQPISLTKSEIKEANVLLDLNVRYRSEWVRDYKSVEISTTQKGSKISSISKNDTLSGEQKKLLNAADVDTKIEVLVRYMPENNLKHNDLQEMDFTVHIEPDYQATFPGGEDKLSQYLIDHARSKISDDQFSQHQLTAVQFTVDEKGQIIDAHMFDEFQTSTNHEVNSILLKAICDMPTWTPAQYSNGLKVKQEFVLTAGDINSCVTNLIHIGRNKPFLAIEE